MRRFYPALFIFCALACNNSQQNPAELKQAPSSTVKTDSNTTFTDEKEVHVERGSYEDDQFKTVAYSRFIIPAELSEDSSYYHRGYYREELVSFIKKINMARN